MCWEGSDTYGSTYSSEEINNCSRVFIFFPGYTSYPGLEEDFGCHWFFGKFERYLERASENKSLMPDEQGELALELLLTDIRRALGELYDISTEGISKRDLMMLSRSHDFWICEDGKVLKERPYFSGGAW